MRKSWIIFATMLFLAGCGATEEAEVMTVVLENETTTAAESEDSKIASSAKIETATPEKVAIIIEEERTQAMEIHVYSDEIPWNRTAQPQTLEFASINEALSNAIEGDVIIVHEGVYREMLNIKKDNITIKAAEGEYVLITGNELVTGFVPYEEMPGVYVADAPANYKTTTLPYSQVFVNGHAKDMARFPNLTIDDMMMPIEEGGGYGEITKIYKDAGTTEANVVFSQDTLPDVDLTGGIFRGIIGKNREYAIGKVVATDGNTVTFEGTNNAWRHTKAVGTKAYGFGYGFVSHKNLLDIPGEWFVEDGKVYYMPDSEIRDAEVEMQVREKVLQMNNVSNVVLENLNFVAGSAEIKSTDNLMVEGCTFRYLKPFYTLNGYGMGDSARTGVYIENSTNNTFKDTYLGHTWGTGFYVAGGDGNSFINCVMEDIGWIGTFTAGVYSSGDNTLIEDCSFRDNGRFQIRVDKDIKIDVLHSTFERAMKMGEDAGPLEFTSTGKIAPLDLKGSEIAYNQVFDLRGIPVSSGGKPRQFVVAFYMEDVNNYTAHHNLVYDMEAPVYTEGFLEGFEGDNIFLYLGPRYNEMTKPVNYYNNTVWDYVRNVNVWNIEIANYDELAAKGLKQEGRSGSLDDGHFVNNLFNDGPFSLSWYTQNLTATGGKIDNVPNPDANWKNITTDSMDEFFAHGEKIGYFFNPETNMILDKETGAQNYVDADNGNFRLAEDSPAKGAGTPIPGITSSETPDLGALEGSDYVLSAGATLEIPIFKEQR
ncbi:right-handed parallel beta-helix repeat-containing protein [Candidatus Epulonipiscium viviparus]|uniref:right-handed parallel beta-helix repeat-containing protein n=1 Tax=Candidatus Epulonipiscium viviparus TaxID=420336 RepID=UPI00273805D7|nr:right-handed parallel beta-helix repeat-containing protein [Candidatus Epulopiscium viviparus]